MSGSPLVGLVADRGRFAEVVRDLRRFIGWLGVTASNFYA